MRRSTQYTMLISSLPHIFYLFGTEQAPLSELQLRSRLNWLDDEDATLLQEIEALLLWQRIPMDESDASIASRGDHLLHRLKATPLWNVLDFFLTQRLLIAALRSRTLGDPPMTHTFPFGYGPLARHIERNYQSPAFGLHKVYTWLEAAESAVARQDGYELTFLSLQWSWEFLLKSGQGHYFDFEAVVIYVLKWHLLDAYLRFDGAAARRRFYAMTEERVQQIVAAGLLKLEPA